MARRGQILLTEAANEQVTDDYSQYIKRSQRGTVADQDYQEPVYEHLWQACADGNKEAAKNPTQWRSSHMDVQYNGGNIILDKTKTKLSVGRTAECDVQFLTDAVSRRHAAITYEDGVFYLQDSSSNGTYLRNANGDTHIQKKTVSLKESGSLSFGAPLEEAEGSFIHFNLHFKN